MANQKIKILIDAGHGGVDSGAVGLKNIKEKNVNLTQALEVGRILKLNGFDVVFTRTTDVYLDINERAKIANTNKVNYVVSIHNNAGGGKGAEVIHSIYEGVSKQLAVSILNEIVAIGQERHGTGLLTKASTQNPDKDYFGIIRDTKAPAVIVESAFIDSDDVKIIDTIDKQKKMAQAIARGIIKFIMPKMEIKY